MGLFQLTKSGLKHIKEKTFTLEKDLQAIVEDNLRQIFNLSFVYTEFQLHGLRIDTLAFDDETKSFVIIEYKNEKNSSVIDQGFSYLSLLVNHKADFILQYNEVMKASLSKNDVDWEQSRVLFLSPQFSKYQQKAIEFQDLPIELWEVRKYENDILLVNQIKPLDTSVSIKTVTRNKVIQEVSNEIKVFSIEDHFRGGREKMKQLYEQISERILSFDSRIVINPRKSYIGFTIDSRNVLAIHVYKSKIDIVFGRTEPKDLKDPESKACYIKNSYKYYNQHLTSITLHSADDVDYAILLAKQVYNRFIVVV